MLFLANQSRPDILYSIRYASRYTSNPNQSHIDAVNHVMSYLNNTSNLKIMYKKEYGINLQGYVNSDFAGYKDTKKSTTR